MIDITVLCGMLMTACDVSAIGKPWELQHELAKKVADEFFDQGDMEKVRLNAQPIVSHNFLILIIILAGYLYSYENYVYIMHISIVNRR